MAAASKENSPEVYLSRASVHGFTLVELLVVLAILGMLAGLTIPRLFRVIRQSRLQQAARQLADDLGAARLLAISHGLPYELRYQRHGARYTIGPSHATMRDLSADIGLTSAVDQDLARLSSADTSSSVDSNSQTPVSQGRAGAMPTSGSRPPGRPVPESINDVLSNGVQFGDRPSTPPQVPVSPSNDSASDEHAALGDSLVSAETLDVNWIHSVVFYPDGRAEKHTLKLTAEDGRSVPLTIRGLTGSVTIGPIARPPRSVHDGIDHRSPPVDSSETTAESADAPF